MPPRSSVSPFLKQLLPTCPHASSLLKGAKGEPGVPGPDGSPGKPGIDVSTDVPTVSLVTAGSQQTPLTPRGGDPFLSHVTKCRNPAVQELKASFVSQPDRQRLGRAAAPPQH